MRGPDPTWASKRPLKIRSDKIENHQIGHELESGKKTTTTWTNVSGSTSQKTSDKKHDNESITLLNHSRNNPVTVTSQSYLHQTLPSPVSKAIKEYMNKIRTKTEK